MWGGLVDYSVYTGDKYYDYPVQEAIFAQSSYTVDFMMPDQRPSLGNDDQVFWALAAMSAAEHRFPVRADINQALYISLAQNVFDEQAHRWNSSTCGGGLKWQIFPENVGFDYKSSIANGGFFQLGARLARYTGNITYVQWADKTYDWMEAVGFVTGGQVHDGANDVGNCTAVSKSLSDPNPANVSCQVNQDQWSYNAAALIHGAATLWNISQADKWKQRTIALVANARDTFFSPYDNASSIMFETLCEREGKCNIDQLSFKAYLARWMAKAALMCADIRGVVTKLLQASAAGAAQACSGETVGTTCGQRWWVAGWDGTKDLGQQLSALETIQALLTLPGNGGVGVPGTADEVHWEWASSDVCVGPSVGAVKRSSTHSSEMHSDESMAGTEVAPMPSKRRTTVRTAAKKRSTTTTTHSAQRVDAHGSKWRRQKQPHAR